MIVAYLKPTNFCNVDCAHCYLPAEVRANKERMSDETLHKVMKFLKEMKEKESHDKISLLWHGGEPLVLPVAYFKNAAKIIDEYFANDEVEENIQTSLIPYKSAHAEIIHNRFKGFVGSSMDFNSRILHGSPQEYQDLWMKKVEMARGDGLVVIPGMVPSKKDCYNTKFIYEWFRDRDFWIWTMDRYSNVGGMLPDFSTNREHSKFLIELFNLVINDIKTKGYAPLIKTVQAGIGGVLFDQPGDRWGGSCQSDFVVINPDGRLNNCPDKDSFEESYGNLNTGFDSFQQSPLRKKWIRIQSVGHRIDECYDCENASWCKSGCPITGNACTYNNEVDDCSGFKTFINHIRAFIKEDKENNTALLEKYFFSDYLPKEFLNKINKSVLEKNMSN